MIMSWMLYTTAVGILLAAAARAAEPLIATRGLPRRWLWVAAVIGVVVLPLTALGRRAAIVMPVSPFPAPRRSTVETGAAPSPTGVVASPISTMPTHAAERTDMQLSNLARFDTPLIAAWIALTGLLLAIRLGASVMLLWYKRQWRRLRIDGETVLVTASVGPAVAGIIRPCILLPAWALGTEPSVRRLILAHEREHLRARDPLLYHAVMVLALLLPWNLPLWWMLHRLQLAIELDCDIRVLRAGGDTRGYTDLLLAVGSGRTFAAGLVGPALVERRSFLFRRILAMHVRQKRIGRLRSAMIASAVGGLLVIAWLAPVPMRAEQSRASQIEQAPKPATVPQAPSNLSAPDDVPRRNNIATPRDTISESRGRRDKSGRRAWLPPDVGDTNLVLRYDYHWSRQDGAGSASSEFHLYVEQHSPGDEPIIRLNGRAVSLDSTGTMRIALPHDAGRILINRRADGRVTIDDNRQPTAPLPSFALTQPSLDTTTVNELWRRMAALEEELRQRAEGALQHHLLQP